MHFGSFNVIYITFRGFILLCHFCQLFEALTAARQSAAGPLQQPIALKLYTKAVVKANPPHRGIGQPQGRSSTPAACGWFQLA